VSEVKTNICEKKTNICEKSPRTNHMITAELRNLLAQLVIWLRSSLLSTYPLATTMAPITKCLCPCFKCTSRKELSRRTIRIHFRENQEHLNNLIATGADQDTVDFVQECDTQITELLSSLAEESQSSRQSRSAYPDGRC
jgi:hypothetical protein